jgi:hypothetical protein
MKHGKPHIEKGDDRIRNDIYGTSLSARIYEPGYITVLFNQSNNPQILKSFGSGSGVSQLTPGVHTFRKKNWSLFSECTIYSPEGSAKKH